MDVELLGQNEMNVKLCECHELDEEILVNVRKESK